MASGLYDDLDMLDGTPLTESTSGSASSNAPMVGLRVAANWTSGDSEMPEVYGSGLTNSNANTSLKFMQSHMAVKRAQGRRDGNAAPASTRSSIAPVVDLKQRGAADGAYRFNQHTGRLERSTTTGRSSGPVLLSPAMTGVGLLFGEPNLPLGVADEYNPLVPNEYYELARLKRERRRAEESAINSTFTRTDDNQSGLCRRPDLSDYEDDEDGDDQSTAAAGIRRRAEPTISKGVAIAPPSVLLEDTTIEGSSEQNTDESQMIGATSKFGINAVAAKMMARMGYREGQGLGRESQGMSTALVVEKTSRLGGKIIHERDQQRQQQQQQQNMAPIPDPTIEETVNLPLPENRSCVILLRNMCGSGEVDDDLEPETAEECSKYGKVVMCMIFELPDAPDDEAVRIFVEFESEESATKAILDLNGRFFAGRVVKAGFYDAEKFRNLELADDPISA